MMHVYIMGTRHWKYLVVLGRYSGLIGAALRQNWSGPTRTAPGVQSSSKGIT